MKKAYPITIQKESDFFVVYIPDFDVNTQGESLAEAIEMARDAIGMAGCYYEDEKREIPEPTAPNAIKLTDGELLSIVDVDLDEYRRKHANRTVRKNLTIPYWLNEEAEKAHINFSAVLQSALLAQLRT